LRRRPRPTLGCGAKERIIRINLTEQNGTGYVASTGLIS
jgi:hypothetical protein